MFRLVVNQASSCQSYPIGNWPVAGTTVISEGTDGVTALFLKRKLSIWYCPCSFERQLLRVPFLPEILPIIKSLFPNEVLATVQLPVAIPLTYVLKTSPSFLTPTVIQVLSGNKEDCVDNEADPAFNAVVLLVALNPNFPSLWLI